MAFVAPLQDETAADFAQKACAARNPAAQGGARTRMILSGFSRVASIPDIEFARSPLPDFYSTSTLQHQHLSAPAPLSTRQHPSLEGPDDLRRAQ